MRYCILSLALLASQIVFSQGLSRQSVPVVNSTVQRLIEKSKSSPDIIFTDTSGQTWGQTNWTWLSPLPQGNILYSVKFISSTIGWAVGHFGTIIKTMDGGESWQIQLSSANTSLKSIAIIDSNNVIVGGSGGILRTTNGGITWVDQAIGISLMGVTFNDANNGIAVGDSGKILRTTNRGTTWISQTSGNTNGLNAVSFATANTGTAVGNNGTILRCNQVGLALTCGAFPLLMQILGQLSATVVKFLQPRTAEQLGHLKLVEQPLG